MRLKTQQKCWKKKLRKFSSKQGKRQADEKMVKVDRNFGSPARISKIQIIAIQK